MVTKLVELVFNARKAYRIRHYDEPDLALLVPMGMRDAVLADFAISYRHLTEVDPDQLTIYGACVGWVTNLTEPLVVHAIPQQ